MNTKAVCINEEGWYSSRSTCPQDGPKYLEEVTIIDWYKNPKDHRIVFQLKGYEYSSNTDVKVWYPMEHFVSPQSAKLNRILTNNLIKDLSAEFQRINK